MRMSNYEHLRVGQGDMVATVSLARPDARNALNARLIRELTRVMEELAGDETCG